MSATAVLPLPRPRRGIAIGLVDCDRQGIRGVVIVLEELVSHAAMSSITYILSFSNAKSRILAFSQYQAIQPTTVQAGGAVSPG